MSNVSKWISKATKTRQIVKGTHSHLKSKSLHTRGIAKAIQPEL